MTDGWGRIGGLIGKTFPRASERLKILEISLSPNARANSTSMHYSRHPLANCAIWEAASPISRKPITTLCQVHAVPQLCDPGPAPTLKAGSMLLQINLVLTRRKPINARSLLAQQAIQPDFQPLGCLGHSGPLSNLQPPMPAKPSPSNSHVKSRPTLKHPTP